MELEIDSGVAGCVPRRGFDNILQQPFPLHDIFQHFQKLRMGFYIVNKSVEKHIAQTLSAATKLRSLCVVAYWETNNSNDRRGGPTAFEEIFGECEFPQLSSLTIQGFTSTEAELLRFLRGSSCLKKLTLRCHMLGWKDEWEPCANEIKLALPKLEHIEVDDLISNHGGQVVAYHQHDCSDTDVQEFFFQGNANPFICAHTQDRSFRVTFTTDTYYHSTWPPGAGDGACVRAQGGRA